MWNHTQPHPLAAETMNINNNQELLSYEQKLHKLLDLNPYLQYLERLFNQPSSESESSDSEPDEPGNNYMWNASNWPKPSTRLQQNSIGKVEKVKSSDPGSVSSSTSSSESNLSFHESSSSSPFSSASTLTSSSSSTDSDNDGDENNTHENGLDSFKLPPITDEELENLFKVHKMWKKSPHPLGSDADIVSLLNASSSHSSSTPKRNNNTSSSSAGVRTFSNSSKPSSKIRNVPSLDKNRSRKQSLKNVRNEESAAAALAATAGINAVVTNPVVSVPQSKPAVPVAVAQLPTIPSPAPLEAIKEEPDAKINEFETLEAKPQVPPPLGNFMEDEDEDEDDDDDESNDGGEDDNDSLSDFVSMAAAAQTGSSQILSATKNILFKNVTSKAPPPTATTTTSASSSSTAPTQPSSSSSEPLTKKKKDFTKKKLSPQKQAKIIEVLNLKRRRVYVLLCKKEIGKTQRARVNTHKENLALKRRFAQACSRILRQKAIQSQKAMKESVWRAKRLTREMLSYWKQADRVEREVRKRREKEAEEQRKLDVELMEAKRQQRKLNFLITQTELYAHFMSKKFGGGDSSSTAAIPYDESTILSQLNEDKDGRLAKIDDYDSEIMKRKAKQNVENAFAAQQNQVKLFDLEAITRQEFKSDLKLESTETPGEFQQPEMFEGVLKHYQLKGLNWLASLYNQGINGILADEMGLGKTVQSMAFLGHIAERYGVWGPFLIIAPASTLHNWQQEFKRFVPSFKVVPYWGTPQERKILRQFWQNSNLHTEEASFHVVVTSYQIVMSDIKYFNRVKWQYLVLDEAQAIKSSSSARWKMLLGFSCRNRLLLTGTPIQNTMAELWALLHFIMPSLFDSHEEFNEWFSKDIESHAENKSLMDEKHLSRLHLILKPFMLRRIKKDVENELSDKIEVLVHCPLTSRQRQLYTALKKKIRIEDLLKSSGPANSQLAQHATTNLMNLVMQFRKVCNHPDLFERRRVQSPHILPCITCSYPRLLFHEVFPDSLPSRAHLLENRLSIFNPANVHTSLLTVRGCAKTSDCSWSFLKFIGTSVGELYQFAHGGPLERWKYVRRLQEYMKKLHHVRNWSERGTLSSFLSSYDFLLNSKISPSDIESSFVLQDLVFAKPSSSLYTFRDHVIFRSSTTNVNAKEVRSLQPTLMPSFLYYTTTKLRSRQPEIYFSDRSAASKQQESGHFASVEECNVVMHGKPEGQVSGHFLIEELGGLEAAVPTHGWSSVVVPAKEKLISDSGKLGVLDMLLKRLKSNSHRVLIYSQMTKMIDILEEYMCLRKWTYMRLDGSSKISERRDMVADFQSRSDIFVFLLSTRAGGLGINLTAADTVIFYDSDWNPTVDQQAMDRAHRLGQTKQVHVYRLICKGTIEERILQRAREKNEIQRMVISGGHFRPDTLKPKEVVSLLLDDEELEKKYRQKQAEKRMDDSKTTEKKCGGDSKIGQPPLKRRKILEDKGDQSSGSTFTAEKSQGSSCPPSPSEVIIRAHGSNNEGSDVEGGELEDVVDDGEKSSSSSSVRDDDIMLEPSSPVGGEYKTIEWNADSVSDYEGEFAVLPKRPKVGRGTGKRGRPPSRVRLPARESDGDSNTIRRGPGRPRLRPIGPANQGIRGRRPGRPPLTRKPEPSASSSTVVSSETISLTPLTASQKVFGFYSFPDIDIS